MAGLDRDVGLVCHPLLGFHGCTNGLSAENPKLPKNFTFEGDLAQRILLLKGTSYKEAPQYLSIGCLLYTSDAADER